MTCSIAFRAAFVAAISSLFLVGCPGKAPEKRPTEHAATNVVSAASATNQAAAAAATVTNSPAKTVEKPIPHFVVSSFSDVSENGYVVLNFNEEPNLVAARDYVSISPNPGPFTVEEVPCYWVRGLRVRARFVPHVTYTITVRAGLPSLRGTVLESEFRRTWTASDFSPRWEYASGGRYLPASGRRAVAVKTMNVSNLWVSVNAVPDRNISQLLAREENVYRRYYGGGGDSADTLELAACVTSRTVCVDARLNEEATTFVDLRNEVGVAENGIYLLGMRDEDGKEYETEWKLVCVTDIGLSVREIGKEVCVWATSLTTGAPIPGLRVRVIDKKNVILDVGLTDDSGLCRFALKDDFLSFAVLAEKTDGSDRSFLALMRGDLDETSALGDRRAYVADDDCEAFVWTERGIYRHGEQIFLHAIFRNGKGNAPKPFPVRVLLRRPDGKDYLRQTLVTDRFGAISTSGFSVPEDQPSGTWAFLVTSPEEENFRTFGEREVNIEEFVPPQIRVKVEPPEEGGRATTNLAFRVIGEQLFGGPAKWHWAEGAVRFSDAPFAPTNWPGFRFGDATRAIKPNFKTLKDCRTDEDGVARFTIDFPQKEKPRAAVQMTVQGSVFQGGGRPATARATTTLHYYPYYIGVALPKSVRESPTPATCRVALVNPDGTPHAGARRLVARFERVEYVYGLQKTSSGCWEWRSDKISQPLGDGVEVAVGEDGLATLSLPAAFGGDISVRVYEEESDVAFSSTYWVGGADDDAVRTPLENPSRVTLSLDREIYYPGERPRLTVKAPFAGQAWLTLLRDKKILVSRVVALTNATSEVELEPVEAGWTPSLDVALSVVQAAKPGERTVANRAFGLVPMRVATRDQAVDVKLDARVTCAPTGGSTVDVAVKSAALAERAVITVVDEGINLLTDEPEPDPVGWFGAVRDAPHPIRDVFNRLLPIYEDAIKRAGAKTGGGAEGDLFLRVSPVPTRRFKPLSLWKAEVPLTNGCAKTTFALPEFVGEVRVTAVVYGTRATGAAAVHAKVAPNLVAQPDAPRFAAPGDTFLATLMLTNRSGKPGKAVYDVVVSGAASLVVPNAHAEIALVDGQSEVVTVPVRAANAPGEAKIVFTSQGFGETHTSEILLPVRPAAPWVTTATTIRLAPGEKKTIPNPSATMPETTRRTFVVSASPVAQLASALSYLVEYPYGCLEQTVSRVFPLVTAGGLLNTLPVRETSVAADAKTMVDAGIRRVCTMIRSNDFSMWPDTKTPPWDREVSLVAAHFLVEANASGFAVPADRLATVKGFLRKWSMETNATESVAACHVLALAGTPDRDRSLFWYDRRATLDALSRARLARAFVRMGDRDRARELLAGLSLVEVKETAFALLAWLDLDPEADVVPGLVQALLARREASSEHWGTTEANAHALLALGAYYQRELASSPQISRDARVPRVFLASAMLSPSNSTTVVGGSDLELENRGDVSAFVSVRTQTLGDPATLAPVSNGITVVRRYRREDYQETDLSDVVRGERLFVEVEITAPSKQTYSDLVVEELLPACFEPDTTPCPNRASDGGWLLRREYRDDRVLGFSTRFTLVPGDRFSDSCSFLYEVRVVSAGEFVVPGVSVEAMYDPAIRARGAATRIKVAR